MVLVSVCDLSIIFITPFSRNAGALVVISFSSLGFVEWFACVLAVVLLALEVCFHAKLLTVFDLIVLKIT